MSHTIGSTYSVSLSELGAVRLLALRPSLERSAVRLSSWLVSCCVFTYRRSTGINTGIYEYRIQEYRIQEYRNTGYRIQEYRNKECRNTGIQNAAATNFVFKLVMQKRGKNSNITMKYLYS